MRLGPIALLLCGLVLIAGGVVYHLGSAQNLPPATTGVKDETEPERSAVLSQAPPAASPPVRSLIKEAATEEAAFHDRLTQTMRTARYAFNHPDVLYLARRAQITLTLAADDRAALDTLKKQFERAVEGTVKTGTTKYAPIMSATLVGRAFRIEPSGEQTRAVFLKAEGPVEWTWFVEPLEPGQGKLLRLNLYASIGQPGPQAAPIRIKTFEARINVDVRPWDRLLFEARRMTPISQALTGLGGLVAFVGFLGALYRWLAP
jgi:hypothetical protein